MSVLNGVLLFFLLLGEEVPAGKMRGFQMKSNKKAESTYSRLSIKYFRMDYLANNLAIAAPISAGLSTTVIPHSLMIFILAAAVSSAPPTIAPA